MEEKKLSSEELEQIAGGDSVQDIQFDVGHITQETYLYLSPNKEGKILAVVPKGYTCIRIGRDTAKFNHVNIRELNRDGYIETSCIYFPSK